MTEYKYYRKKKWFSYIGPGEPGDFVEAVYRGADENGTADPKLGPNGGRPGKTYIVGLLTDKSTAVVAPCPDFCNGGEAPRTNLRDRLLLKAFHSTSVIMKAHFKKGE
ncbi:MAG: hypothetical protein WBP41_04885 [Saprospiraceae bacterium]